MEFFPSPDSDNGVVVNYLCHTNESNESSVKNSLSTHCVEIDTHIY